HRCGESAGRAQVTNSDAVDKCANLFPEAHIDLSRALIDHKAQSKSWMSDAVAHSKPFSHRVVLRWREVCGGSLGCAPTSRLTRSSRCPGPRARFSRACNVTWCRLELVVTVTGTTLYPIDAALTVERHNRMCADFLAFAAVCVDIIAWTGL